LGKILVAWLRRLAIAMGVLVPLGAAVFFVGMRFVGPGPELDEAMRVMRAPTPPVHGNDASDALWLLDYDVPDEQVAAVAAATRRFAGQRDGARPMRDPRLQFPRFAAAPEPGPDQGVCDAGKPGCLDFVMDNRALVAAELDRNRRAVDASLAIAAYDGVRLGVPMHLDTELPSPGSQRRRVLASFAYRFASGERLLAVQAVCRDIGGWRRLGGNSDSLVLSMVGVGFVSQDLMLLTDMMAQMPKDTELPDDCTVALQDSEDYEFDLCPAMRSENSSTADVHEAVLAKPAGDPSPSAWAVDWRNFEALRAGELARYCQPELVAQLRHDHRIILPPAPTCSRWRRMADPAGCLYADISSGSYEKYLDRRADQAQMLALARTVVWLRIAAENPDEVPAVLAKRPASLGLLRQPEYDAGHDRISIDLHDTTRPTGKRFELDAGAEPRPVRAQSRSIGSRRALVFND
jgi:hypothetical protein